MKCRVSTYKAELFEAATGRKISEDEGQFSPGENCLLTFLPCPETLRLCGVGVAGWAKSVGFGGFLKKLKIYWGGLKRIVQSLANFMGIALKWLSNLNWWVRTLKLVNGRRSNTITVR